MKRLVIDKALIKSNVSMIKERASGAAIIADLSCDACGLGLLETARLLRDEGIGMFAVNDVDEARQLRQSGFVEEKIMLLRSTSDSEEITQLLDLGVICTVGSYDAAVAINGIAEARSTVCEVQIKVDTGLGRYGFTPEEIDKISSIYKYMANLAIVGVFTSYSDAWRSRGSIESQRVVFNGVLEKLRAMGYETGLVHSFDSAALLTEDTVDQIAVRAETAIGGRVPGRNISGLKKAGYVEASLEEVCWYPKGHKVAGGKKLRKTTKLAVISVGYHNGFGVMTLDQTTGLLKRLNFRRRSNYVKVNGHKVRVMGRIGMLNTIIDVTKVNCAVGDIAVLDVDPINAKGLTRIYKQISEQ